MVAVPRRTGPAPPPAKLKAWQLWGTRVLVPLTLAMLVVGIMGMTILMDDNSEKPLSRTQFGIHYKWLIKKNPFFSAFFVNFGFMGLWWAVKRLNEHKAALKNESAAGAQPAAGAAKPEAKEETKKAK